MAGAWPLLGAVVVRWSQRGYLEHAFGVKVDRQTPYQPAADEGFPPKRLPIYLILSKMHTFLS